MALSGYNQWAEQVLAADLTASGFRLAFTLQRLLLGFNMTEDGLGRAQLREVSGLHGRSLERATAELVDAGLVEVDQGHRGRGGRTRYRLLLNGRSSAAFSGDLKAAQKAALVSLKRPLQRGHSGFIKEPRDLDFQKVKDELLANGLLKASVEPKR